MPLTADDHRRLQSLREHLAEATEVLAGYPIARDFDIQALAPFLDFPLNNLGDPGVPSTYRIGTQAFEREVVDFMAAHFRAPGGGAWGYVTHGGSEANLHALYLARERFPDGVLYASEASHYSIVKSARILGLPLVRVRAQPHGEIDYGHLEACLRRNRHRPALLVANIGTTMTEARDDAGAMLWACRALGIERRHLHSDAALCGAYAPFLTPRPSFDFEDGAGSVAVSGHKFFGSPIPCGVMVARKDLVDAVAAEVGYTGSVDTTLTGSRNGFTPLVLWHALKTWGVEGLRARAMHALDTAAYAVDRLRGAGIPAWRNENALTVVFPAPDGRVRAKWQLATQDASHLIVMPGLERHHVDALVEDLVRSPVPVGA